MKKELTKEEQEKVNETCDIFNELQRLREEEKKEL